MKFRSSLVTVLCLLPLSAVAGDKITYLALGDSIAFGYDPLVTVPLASNYTGYPDRVAAFSSPLRREANLACPGETSGSFLSATAADRGCRGYKAQFGVHFPYTGTQIDEAIFLLRSERQNIKVVSLNVGANDLLLLQEGCQGAPACIQAGLPAVIGTVAANVATILRRLRTDGGYAGPIVLLTQYSPDYRSPLFTPAIANMNLAVLQAAAPSHVRIADGFSAFALASLPAGGDTCAAGLLVRYPQPLPDGTICDQHPSPKGRDVLALVVAAVATF